jgi:RHS repeat-associated protein
MPTTIKTDLKEDHIATRSSAKTAIHARMHAWFPALWLICAVAASLADTGGGSPALSSVSLAQAPKPSPQLSANPTTEELFRAHVFQEPLVPVGGSPSLAENATLADALQNYAKRSGPDDFTALTGFLNDYPDSSWNAALLTDLGLEYYHTCHYSLAIEAWSNAWALAGKATDAKSVALVSRAFSELIRMDSRLGRMDEVERLLNSIGNKPLPGPAGQHVVEAREALWSMKNRPEISFRCGPLALRSIRMALGLPGSSDAEILKTASTQKGCSLPMVAELSRKIGLNYQMAFRNSGDFIVPSVVHWKVGHYAALVRKRGNFYELDDPTFGNKTWATREALEAETSGYFLVAAGSLPQGWRTVDQKEGSAIWGKGRTASSDSQHTAKNDLATIATCPGATPKAPTDIEAPLAMAVAKVHLMDVNLNLTDQPVGYAPPVGPPVHFVLRYNQRDVFQPGNFFYGNLGPLWTSDWITYITDNPTNPVADVNLYVGGGGQRTYTDFDTNTQSFAYQQYDQNLLTRTGPASYQLLAGDGSKMIFGQSDGAVGTARSIFLTQEIDPQGNSVTFAYDTNLCITSVTDAIGQVTTLTYGLPSTNIGTGLSASVVPADPYKLTKVTDPFGRSATLNYEPTVVAKTVTSTSTNLIYGWQLASDTDVIGITSQFGYYSIATQTSPIFFEVASFVDSLTTPYGTTSFSTNADDGTTRSMEITHPDLSKERVEYNQNISIPASDPIQNVPLGMMTYNEYLEYRNTYYWDRTACALGYGDYTKARIYHFTHTEDLTMTSGCLESTKPPLEGRVWYDYPGQTFGNIIGSNNVPTHIGRVLDDGTTQLYTYAYNGFGHVTNYIDPVGRTFKYVYDTNGIDLLEVRQVRAGYNELLSKATYNSQHLPLTRTDTAGQTVTYSYNARGQLLTLTDPKNETATFIYDTNGYFVEAQGALEGTDDTISAGYDAFGRVASLSDVSGYLVSFDYDNLDRVTSVSYPDGTSVQMGYALLDCASVQDRAGRQTLYYHDNMQQLTSMIDPLGRQTFFEWCRCGAPKSFTDPMGRTTSWVTDVEGRKTSKQFGDGSSIQYLYDNTSSRLVQVIDEKQQSTFCTYNPDNTIASMSYGNSALPTPSVSFTYDPNYKRITSMTDGIGTATYGYNPITSPPLLGAGRLGSVNGPLPNETVTYAYDQLGRPVQTSIDGVLSTRVYDALDRPTSDSNALGSFTYSYAGASTRLLSATEPNGLTALASYGPDLQDFTLQQLTYAVGATPISQFTYGRDIPRMQITNWSQQAGAQSPTIFSFGYDAANQLLSGAVTSSGAPVTAYAYTYDPSANRLSELAGGVTANSTYNALNQFSTTANAAVNARTNQWDGQQRLTIVTAGNLQTVFGYDGASRLAYIQQLENGSQVSFRRFVWCNGSICEERDATGTVITKRYFPQGVLLQTGTNSGPYYYTRDHLGSIREMTDASGNVRARYSYDPFGRQTKISGDVDADFAFAGMFWSPEASLTVTHFRAYDPNLGRWLSRDPLKNAEIVEGPNLYAYAANDPVNLTDPSGLDSFFKPGDMIIREKGDMATYFNQSGRTASEQEAFYEALDQEVIKYAEDILHSEPDYYDPYALDEADVNYETPELQPRPGLFEEEPPRGTFLPVEGLPEPSPVTGIGIPVIGVFVGAAMTVLTMTDCNTAQGILGLVRQGKGGLLNVYEDAQMKELSPYLP